MHARVIIKENLTEEYVKTLKVSDFTFKNVESKEERKELKKFIERHEWLGTLSQYTTQWFACYHKENSIYPLKSLKIQVMFLF